MMKSMGFKIQNEEADLLKKVSDARGENISNFVRRSILTELAKLGYCPAEQLKALGLPFRKPLNHPPFLKGSSNEYNDRIFKCPNCEVNVFESGIVEVPSGGVIKFDQIVNQWVTCEKCSKTIPGITTEDLLFYFEGINDFNFFTLEITNLKDQMNQPVSKKNVEALTENHAIEIVKKELEDKGLVEMKDYKIDTCYFC